MQWLEYYFSNDVSLIDQKVYQDTIENYKKNYKKLGYSSVNNELTLDLIRDFSERIERTFISITDLQNAYKEFSTTLNASHFDKDKRSVIIEFVKLLGTTDIKGDIKSFKRWFDADAATERYLKKVSTYERDLKYLFDRLSYFLKLRIIDDPDFLQSLVWDDLDIKSYFLSAFYYPGDHRVKHYAFESLTKLVSAIPQDLRESRMSSEVKQFIIRFSQDSHQSIELQQDALTLLIKFSRDSFQSIAKVSLQKTSKDYFFVRAHVAKLICLYKDQLSEANTFIDTCANDESAYVRQALFEYILIRNDVTSLQTLIDYVSTEKNSKVIASAILSLANFKRYSAVPDFQDLTRKIFNLLADLDEYATRCLLHVVPSIYNQLELKQKSIWLFESQIAINELRNTTDSSKVRKWCSQALNNLWILSDEERLAISEEIRNKIQNIPLSKRKKIKLPLLKGLSNEDLGRLLSVLNLNDFPINLSRNESKLKITRWYHFRFRFWRFLFELRNSTTDKRQAHYHMIGRVFYGNMSVPADVLGEQTATKVPGEPLFEPSEDGPRNFLPLVDELISCLEQDWPIQPLEIYSSDGVTEIIPPRSLWKRFLLKMKLSWSFEEYANLRNWSAKSQEKANHYVTILRELGFVINYRDYTSQASTEQKSHSSITKFFSLSFAPFLSGYWENVRNYFGSVYSNNLQQLLIFLVGLFSLFFIKHTWLNIQVNKSRKKLPLSIGGWGTRGKSGTERLKAALFNALGLNVISKTTGCEAMFLHGLAHGNLKEMFLFRPYDKATIWEQVNLLRLSTRLGADVFLWECMGLTPSYVHILQRHWMRDDFVTITNTYPDHEDVQGPAGYDIPTVMVEFIPENSTLITSEEVMYPILKHGADKLNTSCHPVTWIETGRITNDILERFPYEEHPNNIALVSRLAELMGINKDFAERSMADNVVLDLGVLKTYPESKIRQRTLQYVMGNSANERLGAMGNWTRMGFDKHDLVDDAGTWITTVINNRADRVPRSKVFASMLVKDVSADKHFLIGTNVDGFMKFLNEAWDDHYLDYSIWGNVEENRSVEDALKECEEKAINYRIVYSEAVVMARIVKILNSLDITILEDYTAINKEFIHKVFQDNSQETMFLQVWAVIENWINELESYQSIINNLNTNKDKSNSDFVQFLRTALIDRVVIVHDSTTTGEAIINIVADHTPVGFFNRIMGMQNIKGTGLDFVYRWQAWESCYASLQKLYSKKQSIVAEGLQELRSFKEYGALSNLKVLEVIKEVSGSKLMQSDLFQGELKEIETNLTLQMSAQQSVPGQVASTSKDNKYYKSLITFLEKVVDISDAVKRRKKADLIYEDMANQRISHSKAALELQDLTKRQKGGWLWKSLKN